MSKITCDRCESTRVISCDNESLTHDEKWLDENNIQYDNELYVTFRCRDCGEEFTLSFELHAETPKPITQTEEKD